MDEPTDLNSLWSRLLAQDSQVAENEYRDYREKLTRSLGTARRNERIAYWVCAVSGVTMFLLMFVGGSGVVGGFDPWDKDATPLLIALGVIYVISSVLFWLLLASYYSRFRPATRQADESLRDIQILQIAARLDLMQKDLASLMSDRLGAESAHKTKSLPPAE